MNPFKSVKGLFNYASEVSRKRRALTFRKTLGVYNYKVNQNSHYKNPHGIPFKLREELYNNKNGINQRKLYFLKRNSNKPYGAISKQGHFVMDHNKLPVYDIPSTSNFYLKPFINKKSPCIFPRNAEDKSNKFNLDILDKVRTQLLLSEDKKVRRLGLELFETEFGKQVVDEFLDSQERNFFLDEKNIRFSQNKKKLREKISIRDLKRNLPYYKIKIFEDYPTAQKNTYPRNNKEKEIEFKQKRYTRQYLQTLASRIREKSEKKIAKAAKNIKVAEPSTSLKVISSKRNKSIGKKVVKAIEFSGNPVDSAINSKI